MQFKEFVEFQTKRSEPKQVKVTSTTDRTPEELIEGAIDELNSDLGAEILKSLLEAAPAFFEKVVVELLVKMGYGGSRREAGQVVGKSGDEGIDGIIKEDKLGLDTIYIQAKRWDNVVSRPEIQKFVGALQGLRAKKGIFITTSRFSKEATEYARSIESKVILVDGDFLASLMIEHEIGVSTVNTYSVKKIDSDYFLDE